MKNIAKSTRRSLTLFGAAFLALPTLTQAEEAPFMGISQSDFSSFYVELFGGYAVPRTLSYNPNGNFKMDDGWNVGGSIGMNFSERLEGEFEIFYTEAGYEGFSTELSSLALNLNLIYNVPIAPNWIGYIGAGVGATRVEYDGKNQFPGFSDAEWSAGYNGVIGIRYEMTTNLDVFAEYRYSDVFSDTKLAGINVESKSSDVSLGLRMKF